MAQQLKSQGFSMDEPQSLCDDCKVAINEQRDEAIQQAMRKVCDTCRKVKAHVPELMELRMHMVDIKEQFSDKVA